MLFAVRMLNHCLFVHPLGERLSVCLSVHAHVHVYVGLYISLNSKTLTNVKVMFNAGDKAMNIRATLTFSHEDATKEITITLSYKALKWAPCIFHSQMQSISSSR